MKVVIRSEEELAHKFRAAVHILENLRKFQILWEESYGKTLKERKKYWEQKSDEFLKELDNAQIKIKS